MKGKFSNFSRMLYMCWKKHENFSDSMVRRNHFHLRIKKNIEQALRRQLIIKDELAILK